MPASNNIDWVEDNYGCWNCTSHKTNRDGYPSCIRNYQHHRLNRFIYEECFGEIPQGMIVRHKCDNRKCINPEHLELGTIKQNTHDMKRNGTWLSGEGNGFHKLNWENVQEIRRTYKFRKGAIIAKRFGVSTDAIQLVVKGKTWTHDNYGRCVYKEEPK